MSRSHLPLVLAALAVLVSSAPDTAWAECYPNPTCDPLSPSCPAICDGDRSPMGEYDVSEGEAKAQAVYVQGPGADIAAGDLPTHVDGVTPPSVTRDANPNSVHAQVADRINVDMASALARVH